MGDSDAVFWNPLDPEFRSNPYPHYADLRERDPYHRSPMGALVLSRHADCLAVLRDKRMSSDETKSTTYQAMMAEAPPREPVLGMRPFLFLDPPDHTRLRGLVAKAFTARVVEELRPRVQELVDELLTAALETASRSGGEIDLIEELAYPLPVRVISDLLGVPPDDQETFKSWSHALARGLDPELLLTPDELKRRDEAVVSFVEYFTGLIAKRRRAPAGDLLSRLVAVEEQGEMLTEDELLSTCILLLVAGHETTVNLIGNGVAALVGDRGQLEKLRDNSELIRSAVEELLRWDSPVQLTARVSLDKTQLGEAVIEEGDFLILLIASANHDPDVFEHPETLDVQRADNRHLSFGMGTHFCLGAPLARLESQIAINSLLARAPDLALADDELTYKENLVLRGLRSLRLSTSVN